MIKKISYSCILDAPNWNELEAMYALDCLVKNPVPQRQIYENMEKAGLIHCFGAYIEDQLVGFISIVISIMPHHGKKMASIESIFALREFRKFGVGNQLIKAARDFAEGDGCELIVYSPRIDSEFEKVVSRRPNCTKTHTMFMEKLK